MGIGKKIASAQFVRWMSIPALVFVANLESSAWAVSALKQVQAIGDDQIDLVFDREVDIRQVKQEFVREIVQLNLNNVAVYPPKILSLSGNNLLKVFAYQYTPSLVRCRLTIKGKAEDYKNRVVLKANGKVLSVKVLPQLEVQDKVMTQAAKALAAPVAPPKSQAPVPAAPLSGPQDKGVYDKVLRSEGKALESNRLAGHGDGKKHHSSNSPISSLFKTFGMLVLVLMGAGLLLFTIRRILNKKGGSKGWISRMLGGKFGRDGRLIEVVATHYLGPNKSIAVVKIQGRKLVLGVTDKSINLITHLEGLAPEEDLDALMDVSEPAPKSTLTGSLQKTSGSGAISAGPSVFSEMLGAETVRPATKVPQSTSRVAGAASSAVSSPVRDQIRKRLEGMKNL